MSVATDRLALYLAAEVAVLQGQSYTIGDRTLTRADLRAIQTQIKELQKAVVAEQLATQGAYGPRVRVASFR